MSDNKIWITIELTPDDELVARNAVTDDELARQSVDPLLHAEERADAVRRVLDVVRAELHQLLVEENPTKLEYYT